MVKKGPKVGIWIEKINEKLIIMQLRGEFIMVETEEHAINLQITTATLGAGNEGQLGPQPKTPPQEIEVVREASADPKYEKPVTTQWFA